MLIEQITQAITLFGLGISTVFVLLSLLITCIILLSKICMKFETSVLAVPDTGIMLDHTDLNIVSEQNQKIVIGAVKAHRQVKGL